MYVCMYVCMYVSAEQRDLRHAHRPGPKATSRTDAEPKMLKDIARWPGPFGVLMLGFRV